MNAFKKLGNALMNSEYVSRKVKRYKEDAEYRYNLQEGIVYTTVTVGSMVVFIGGIVFLAYKFPADYPEYSSETTKLMEAAKAVSEGLTLTGNMLENIAVEGRQFFETPQGMFTVEFYSDLPVLY
jgi:hypothetical protein